MSLPAAVIAVIILISGFVIFKNLPINQPQPTPDKGFQATMNQTEASPSASLKPTVSYKPTPKPSTSAKPTASPTPQSTQSSSSNSSNNNSSGSTTTSNNQTASSAPSTTATATPTPTPATASCSGLCFDRGSASVEITEGVNLENGGYVATAFNLIGDGTHGFQLNSTGLPAGISITPSSGGFGETTFPVKMWVSNNNSAPYGTYSGTITLKQGPSYNDVGTMSITVTYKKP